MSEKEQEMTDEIISEASMHINTAYGLIVDFAESYFTNTDVAKAIYDISYRNYVIRAKIDAILFEILNVKNTLDVYVNPNSPQLEATFADIERKHEIIVHFKKTAH